jgi:hypothetical protein
MMTEGDVMPGKRLRSITPKRRGAYEAMKKSGMSKQSAARIANAGKTKAGRSAMAKKAARTRKKS